VVGELSSGADTHKLVARVRGEIAPKLPGAVFAEEWLTRFRGELPERARDLALALLEKGSR